MPEQKLRNVNRKAHQTKYIYMYDLNEACDKPNTHTIFWVTGKKYALVAQYIKKRVLPSSLTGLWNSEQSSLMCLLDNQKA